MTEPIQLLQINIISARDLAPVCGSMSTYAVGWVDPEKKQTTRVDHKGNNCPEWNDKFVFRVTPGFLKSESTTFVIEIYTQAWLRDVIIGSVRVSVASLVPTPNSKGTARRAVALQIRRPSGRPQGILNVSVSVIDGTMRSMPLSGLDVPDGKVRAKPESTRGGLRRVKSERSWSATDVDDHRAGPATGPEPTNGPTTRPASSLGGSLCTDVGPSPSVVAAAVAKGLYLPAGVAKAANRGRRGKQNDDAESSILQWEDEQSEEGVMSKIERWKTELHHPMTMYSKEKDLNERGARQNRRVHRRAKTETGRLFRCFGKVCGFEFTIVCGGNNQDNKKERQVKDNGSILL
ncbi:hypothetical protein RND81_04G215700 [Saponaria officinalis]|uniref:C2 domain-containing protein n=1 Tax=Saponaria officinalis TaxID=3572 RepID=A0AAW1LFX7_SAPOF